MRQLHSPTATGVVPASLDTLAQSLTELAAAMRALASEQESELGRISPPYTESARNLLHYLAMRRRDLRLLQTQLAEWGLSSLGRAEADALAAVEAVRAVVQRLRGEHARTERTRCEPCGTGRLEEHTRALFGPLARERSVRIMVTMSSEGARDYTSVRKLLEAGMDCMRINCAHDEPAVWLKMIEHLRRACRLLGRSCPVLMDLGGPKLRTGPIATGPAVLKLRPTRDALGAVTAPAAVWLTAVEEPLPAPSAAADGTLAVARAWLQALEVGEHIGFRDARGRRRELTIAGRDHGGVWAEVPRTSYFLNDTLLERLAAPRGGPAVAAVAGIAPSDGVIYLEPDAVLVLTRDSADGHEAVFDSAGQELSPARVSCTLPEVFSQVQPGDRVFLDDGKIAGVAESVTDAEIRIRIRETPPQGARLKADKGINLPDSRLTTPALTAKDKEDLDFVVRHADLVGLSFVNRPADVEALLNELAARTESLPGIILKIETRQGFACLPELLLTAMRHDRIGVMIARGDLAVECGFERLAEVQEEILWIGEAAHVPVVWATQVLENLAKTGMPSRAEVTDAAMGHRAECVMLNKGRHIERAVRALDDILGRMAQHQSKKRAMLRSLRLASEFGDVPPR